jgi:hypothetical protein
MLDIRLPIGLMFIVKGIILILYGLFSDPSHYTVSLGINVNRDWGAAMLLFGIVMLAWSRLAPDKPAPEGEASAEPRPHHHH